MLKKLFVAAAAAAAVSVPLAGAAWATPDNNVPPGQRDDTPKPGIPGVVGRVATGIGTNPNPGGVGAVPPGQGLKGLKGDSITIQLPGQPAEDIPITGGNRPERYASFIEQVLPKIGGPTLDLDKLPSGLGVKSGTPACKSGKTGGDLGLCN